MANLSKIIFFRLDVCDKKYKLYSVRVHGMSANRGKFVVSSEVIVHSLCLGLANTMLQFHVPLVKFSPVLVKPAPIYG
jgi:hypothetical protein